LPVIRSSSSGFRVARFDAVDVEGGETLAGDAVSFFLPFLARFEDLARLRRVLTAARLLRASDDRLSAALLRALTRVTVVFKSLADFVDGSILFAAGGQWRRSAGRGVTLYFSTNIASALGARVGGNVEFLSNGISHSLVLTTARVLRAFQLSIRLAFASIALFLHFGTEWNGLAQILTITRHRVFSTIKLSVLHAGACIALISVELSSDIDGSAVVLASTGVVGTFNLSRGLAGARVAGILR